VEPIFQALSTCQALHPDEDQSISGFTPLCFKNILKVNIVFFCIGDELESFDVANPCAGIGESDEISFDEHGQVVYNNPNRPRRQMRGVARG